MKRLDRCWIRATQADDRTWPPTPRDRHGASVVRRCERSGLSLLELLAVVMLMGVLALVVVPRVSGGAAKAKNSCCEVNAAIIDIQCALWRRDYGAWPASDLQVIGKDKTFFPEGLPVCPHGHAYKFDGSEGRVIAHKH
ncbi:MAG: prepilin-type N-terminal cleavage/methylation domain-containing protein [Pirellulaceae bacterium]